MGLLSILVTLVLIPSFVAVPAKAYNHASVTDISTAIDAGVAWLAAQQDGAG